jgi:hypothetical protein
MDAFFALTHPVDVTPMELAAALADNVVAYGQMGMGMIYKKTRAIPVFTKVRSWKMVVSIFEGEDDELIDEMARIVTEAIKGIITLEMKEEMHERYLKHMDMMHAEQQAESKVKADAVLAAL